MAYLILLITLTLMMPAQVLAIFDMHEHFREGGNMAAYLRAAKKLGIEGSVFVPTGSAPDNAGYEKHMEALLREWRRHGKRVIPFCSVEDQDPRAAKIFDDCLRRGGKGLKLMSGHPDFYNAPLNSDNMKKLFAVAREHDVPVMIHVSVYRLPRADKEFKSLLDEFRGVRVINAHYCSAIYSGVHLELCAAYLDRYPNVYTDLSMGGGLPRLMRTMQNGAARSEVRDFILKYQDRLLFGTDMILFSRGNTTSSSWIEKRIRCDLDLLERSEFRCAAIKGIPGDEKFPGLELPKKVLQKIYKENPRRFLAPDTWF